MGIGLIALAAGNIVVLLVQGAFSASQLGIPSFRGLDKLLHFAAHFWVSFLLFAGAILLARPTALRARVAAAACAVLVIDGLCGIAVELVQATLGADAGRRFDWLDIAANVAGSVAATCACISAVGVLARKRP